MSIADDLNSIRTHLQDDYTALEQLGVSVEDRNIENIKDMANQIYAKFPKTSYSEGSNITLSNCLKGKLDFEDGIVGIGDTEQYTTTGIQLLNIPDIAETTKNGITYSCTNGILKLNGTATNGLDIWLWGTASSGQLNLESGAYTFAGQVISGSRTSGVCGKYVRNTAEASNIIDGNQIEIYTQKNLTESYSNCSVYLYISNGTVLTNLVVGLSLVSGSYTSSTMPDFEQYTGGQASPNPTFPQEIEVVRGKNIYNPVNVLENCLVNASAQIANTSQCTTIWFKCNQNTTYTLSRDKGDRLVVAGGNIQPVLNAQLTMIDDIGASETTTYTFNSGNFQYIAIYISRYTTTKPTQIQIEKGSATSYLPYNTLEVVERGKNLFNPDITGLFKAWCTVTENNGEITITATQNGDIYIGNVLGVGNTYIAERGKKIYVKPNTRYTIVSTNNNVNKIFFTEFDSNNISLGYAQANTLTTKANTSYITIRYGLENAVNGTSYKTKIMVAEGTDTTYEPYQTPQTYQLSLGEYEFAKIGNYVDTIEYDVDEDKVYKGKKINNISLGSFARLYTAEAFGVLKQYGYWPFADSKSLGNPSYNFYCNRVSKSNGVANDYSGFFNAKNFVVLLNDNDTLATANEKINGSKFYYILDTEVKEEITGTLATQIKALYNSHSFTGTTIIEINGQLPLIIKVRALKGE